jgi:hypothetical protein
MSTGEKRDSFAACRALLDRGVHYASFEWLLGRYPNGGDMVLARALGVSALLCAIALLARELIDPTLHGPRTFTSFRANVILIAPWFAGAVGAVYAALYARFASQWGYLAGLYNQIKQAELRIAQPPAKQVLDALSEWKAGYIEDAHDLHLHTKPNVAAIIHNWGSEPDVKAAFCSYSAGADKRWSKIKSEADAAFDQASSKYALYSGEPH